MYVPLYSTQVKCGSVIRLQHLQTRLFLHSHNFVSPLSGNQEVSCFGDGSQGDRGVFCVQCSEFKLKVMFMCKTRPVNTLIEWLVPGIARFKFNLHSMVE